MKGLMNGAISFGASCAAVAEAGSARDALAPAGTDTARRSCLRHRNHPLIPVLPHPKNIVGRDALSVHELLKCRCWLTRCRFLVRHDPSNRGQQAGVEIMALTQQILPLG